MNKAKLKRLLQQYFDNTISRADCAELLDYLNTTPTSEIEDIVSEDLLRLEKEPGFNQKQSQAVLNRIKSDSRFASIAPGTESNKVKSLKFYQKSWLRAAAALLLFSAVGLWLMHLRSDKPVIAKVNVKRPANAIVPGSEKATLTTDDGKVISLDNAANGTLAQNSNYSVLKAHRGQIVYSSGSTTNAVKLAGYNTLTTPKGGEYQVVLPDGTKVWLNAASSLRYPSVFNGNERQVQLTGEAYFEVAKNEHKPFYVNMNGTQVRVLGTHFNISAYNDDEAITTTLLEGSVQISKAHSLSLLRPGQQAVVNYASDHITVSQANIDEAMSWKNGYFIFDDDNIGSIMKKVSRWYDVDVQYRSSFSDQKFGGTFHRSKSITDLLRYLEKIGGLHFMISGRRIIVMN